MSRLHPRPLSHEGRGEGRARGAALLVLLVACGRSAPAASVPDGSRPQEAGVAAAAADPVREELWAQAKGGDAGELARLAEKEGAAGLVERGADPAWRLVALRALAFSPDPAPFAGLPFLADAARTGDDAQAEAALDSVLDLAARPRLAFDVEDGEELKTGAEALLALAKDDKAARARRVKAIRALRMLSDRGAVDPAGIPTELDAR